MTIVSTHAELGRIYWGYIRNLILLMRNEGYAIEMVEGSGWIAKPFFFRGDPRAIERIRHYIKCLEANA